jgi:hypothetical protein
MSDASACMPPARAVTAKSTDGLSRATISARRPGRHRTGRACRNVGFDATTFPTTELDSPTRPFAGNADHAATLGVNCT